jgi:hypothetical protein
MAQPAPAAVSSAPCVNTINFEALEILGVQVRDFVAEMQRSRADEQFFERKLDFYASHLQ